LRSGNNYRFWSRKEKRSQTFFFCFLRHSRNRCLNCVFFFYDLLLRINIKNRKREMQHNLYSKKTNKTKTKQTKTKNENKYKSFTLSSTIVSCFSTRLGLNCAKISFVKLLFESESDQFVRSKVMEGCEATFGFFFRSCDTLFSLDDLKRIFLFVRNQHHKEFSVFLTHKWTLLVVFF
jgi:hypothetical protein